MCHLHYHTWIAKKTITTVVISSKYWQTGQRGSYLKACFEHPLFSFLACRHLMVILKIIGVPNMILRRSELSVHLINPSNCFLTASDPTGKVDPPMNSKTKIINPILENLWDLFDCLSVHDTVKPWGKLYAVKWIVLIVGIFKHC